MDKKQVVDLLATIGISIKPNQVEKVELVGERSKVNSAGTNLYTYKVKTKVGTFLVDEELVPNVYGATAFSTEKNFVIRESNPLKEVEENLEEEEEEEIGESDTTEVESEEL